jgi:hypothetical protein
MTEQFNLVCVSRMTCPSCPFTISLWPDHRPPINLEMADKLMQAHIKEFHVDCENVRTLPPAPGGATRPQPACRLLMALALREVR